MKKKGGYVLAAVCENCINWDFNDSAKSKKGWCLVFNKETAWDHGQQCTAFECWPSDQDKMADLARDE